MMINGQNTEMGSKTRTCTSASGYASLHELLHLSFSLFLLQRWWLSLWKLSAKFPLNDNVVKDFWRELWGQPGRESCKGSVGMGH